jgi:hypothetical protein
MRWGWRWTWIIVAVGLADVAVRIATGFDMRWVVRAEAVLFLAAGVLLWRLRRRHPAPPTWPRRVQGLLIWAFGLGGLRAALWAGGLPVAWANLAVAGLGVLLAAAAWRRRTSRIARAPETPTDSTSNR